MERAQPPARPGATPVDRSTVWAYEHGEPGRFYYQRYGHPTGTAAEDALGALDGGRALVFPSGSGATTALVLALLEPGETVAVADDAYYGTPVLLRMLERWGLHAVDFDQTGPPPPGARLVWLEAPSNPLLRFPDLEAAIERAHAQGALVAVDATAATPVLLRPLQYGADFVVHSATKYLAGHHDALLGAVCCRDADHAAALAGFRSRSGIVAAPDPCWLLLRGLETLAVRVERASATALELARRLAAHSAVERVRYPGLGDETAARYLPGAFGGLLSFDVSGGEAAARRVETSTRRIVNATSLGGTRSLVETRHRWEAGRVPANLVRLSVGLEPVDELWDDLDRALRA
jgi:cystathionine gamma-synthase